jgi:hypothetical protein
MDASPCVVTEHGVENVKIGVVATGGRHHRHTAVLTPPNCPLKEPNTPQNPRENRGEGGKSGAESGAVGADPAEIVAAWPGLSTTVRAKVLVIVRGGE